MLVQKLRLQRGWSQQQLADLSGLSIRTIQRIERGQSSSPESLKSLAAVFEIDFTQLLSEPDMEKQLSNGVSADEVLAFQHVRKIKGFYLHLAQYLLVVGGLTAINIMQMPRRRLWVLWVAFGWGIGVLSHALRVFDLIPFFGADWEKKQVEKRLGRSL